MTLVPSPSTTTAFVAQSVPRDETITSVSASFSTSVALSLVGTTVTVQVQLYEATPTSNVFHEIPGAETTLAPPLTGVDAIGTTMSGITTGLAIPVTAGSKLIEVASATATGVTLINTVSGAVSVGVGAA